MHIYQHTDLWMIGRDTKMGRLNTGEIENKIMEIISRMLKDSVGYTEDAAVYPESQIRGELGFDSIMLVILQIEVEDAFHIRFNPVEEDLQYIFASVRTLASAVLMHIGE